MGFCYKFNISFTFSSIFWGKPYTLQISLTCYQIAQIFLHSSPEVQQCFCFPQACCVTFFPTPKLVIHHFPSSSSCSFSWGKDNRLGIIWGLVSCLSPHLFLILLFFCMVAEMQPPTSTHYQPFQRLVVKFLICSSVCSLLQPKGSSHRTITVRQAKQTDDQDMKQSTRKKLCVGLSHWDLFLESESSMGSCAV